MTLSVGKFFIIKAIFDSVCYHKRMQKFSHMTRWIPVTSLRPLSSFPQRLAIKIRRIFTDSTLLIGANLGINGAKIVGLTKSGNTVLKLNRDSFLGLKGSLIEAPRDRAIFESVRKYGNWEIKVSGFISECLKSIDSKLDDNSILLDIGANVGLVSVQAVNMARSHSDVYLFEPIERHVEAIRNNIAGISQVCKVQVEEFALSDEDGVSIIYIENSNQGNSSLFSSVVPLNDRTAVEISTVETSAFVSRLLRKYDHVVVKSDTQGMDAMILAKFPDDAWAKVQGAAVEVWAMADISKCDVERLINLWTNFEYVSWEPNFESAAKLSEVSEYWLSGSNEQRNLYLKRNLLNY